jgi:hypothetical protein
MTFYINYIFLITVIILFIIIITLLFYKYYKNRNKYCNKIDCLNKIEYFNNNLKELNNIVCFYTYYEKDDLYKNNFKFFLENGILNNVDYYIIINGECSVYIPEKNNIVVYKRENKGYDFGAYSYAIKKLHHKYEYYFFINTSVFSYSSSKRLNVFAELLHKDVESFEYFRFFLVLLSFVVFLLIFKSFFYKSSHRCKATSSQNVIF